jgi:hypothetical protein
MSVSGMMPSKSDFSDSALPLTSLWDAVAEFSEAEEPQNINLLPSQRPRRTRNHETWRIREQDRNDEKPTEASPDTTQGRTGNLPDEGASGTPLGQARLVNVALEGMLPVMMRETGVVNGTELGGSSLKDGEMEKDCPLPSTRTVTTTTDPVVKVSWGPDKHMFASGEAMKIGKRLREKEKAKMKAELKRNKKEMGLLSGDSSDRGPHKMFSDELLIDGLKVKFAELETGGQEGAEDEAGQIREQYDGPFTMKQKESPMPPPGTPHTELDDQVEHLDREQLKHSLSTPTLPTFHSVSDAALVAKYRSERAKEPAAFDKKTAGIKHSVRTAKLRRGGSDFLKQGDYTVELASREDAATVDKWQNGEKTLGDISENEDAMEEEWMTKADKSLKAKRNQRQSKDKVAGHNFIPVVPANFDVAEDLRKYTTSGYMRQQSTRQVEEDEAGRKTTYSTWIEIKQEVFVPKGKDYELAEVLEAKEQGKGKKRAERLKEGAEKTEEGVVNDKKNGKKRKQNKQSCWKVTDDGNEKATSSWSSGEDHDDWCPYRRFQKEPRTNETIKKADEAKRRDGAEHERKIDPIKVATVVGELVTAIEELRDDKADLLEAVSKQLQEVAKLVG